MTDKDKENCFGDSQPTPDKPDDSQDENAESKKDDNAQPNTKTSQNDHASFTESPKEKPEDSSGIKVLESLENDIPDSTTIDLPSRKVSVDTIIDRANEEARRFLEEALLPEIPGKVTVQFIKNNASKDVLIKTANEKARDKAHFAIINAFSENEKVRVKRQKHLLWAVVVLTSIQLLFFNGIIAGVAFGSFVNGQPQILNRLFDILKYYIGATVAELLGMVFFITKGTFSSSHIETMKMLFPQKKE